MTEFACLWPCWTCHSILAFAFGSAFGGCPASVVIKKSLGFVLILEGQVKGAKVCFALPQFLGRVGRGGCGNLLSAGVNTS